MKKRINSNAKGKRGERELANWLKERGVEARRGQQFAGGGDSPDVVTDMAVHIECKLVRATDIYGWLAQAKRDAKPGNLPVVVHRKNGKDWVAIIDMNDMLELLKMREVDLLCR